MNMPTKTPTISVPQVAPYAPGAELADRAYVLKALAEPTRLAIVAMVASRNGEAVCACELPDALGITQPTASHHLKRLTDAGILTREQRGKWAWFSIVPGGLQDVQQFLQHLIPASR